MSIKRALAKVDRARLAFVAANNELNKVSGDNRELYAHLKGEEQAAWNALRAAKEDLRTAVYKSAGVSIYDLKRQCEG